jgi:hypothetical protein
MPSAFASGRFGTLTKWPFLRLGESDATSPLLGADLGAFISFEARHPELEGRPSFGAEVSEFAHADRRDCARRSETLVRQGTRTW